MSERTTLRGVGFPPAVLTLLFVGLKLTHTVDWSWWWVLAPVWVPVAWLLLFTVLSLGLAGAAWWAGPKVRP